MVDSTGFVAVSFAVIVLPVSTLKKLQDKANNPLSEPRAEHAVMSPVFFTLAPPCVTGRLWLIKGASTF